MLDEVFKLLEAMPDNERNSLIKDAETETTKMLWLPDPDNKPQMEAYYHPADEIYYGGEAGGGKTDLIIGLSLTAHQRSLVLRRTNKEAEKLPDRYAEIIGSRDGFNGQAGTWRIDGRIIDIGGCQHEDDKQKRKGIAHDLKAFDEITDFTETQYTFIIGWNRSSDPKQRCRVLATGNPPTTAQGYWVIKRWAPWLDPNHPNPAKSGEIRWFTTDEEGSDTEVDGPGPHIINGRPEYAKSRTFIRARLADNKYLGDDYRRTLAAMPEPYRSAYLEGRFDTAMRDQNMQLIPTDWVRKAQARWKPTPPPDVPMTAIGVDVARGGKDKTVLACRYDGWYAPITSVPGSETPDGPSVAGLVVAKRKNNAHVIIDMGGGYGGSPYDHLCANIGSQFVTAYDGSRGQVVGRTEDRQLGFFNRRSQIWWEFREALDPEKSFIALPDDAELVADLTAPTFEIVNGKIKVESKGDGVDSSGNPKPGLIKRLGRSPDKGDAVVQAWSEGDRALTNYIMHNVPTHRYGNQREFGAAPKVVDRYANRRRK